MTSGAELSKFFSNTFQMLQVPEKFSIGDDASQYSSKLNRYIDNMGIKENQEKIQIFMNTLEQNP